MYNENKIKIFAKKNKQLLKKSLYNYKSNLYNNINIMNTFKTNKLKYQINLNENIIQKKWKDNKINISYNKVLSSNKKLILNKSQTITRNISNIKNSKEKYNIRRKLFFKKKSIYLNKSSMTKQYESINLKNRLNKLVNLKNYNNYFNSKLAILKENKNIWTTIPTNNLNLKKFNLIFKKKEEEKLLELENNLLKKEKKLDISDNKYNKINNLKLNFFKHLKKKLKKKLKKQSTVNNSIINEDNVESQINTFLDWSNLITKILKYCIKDYFNPYNKSNKSINSLTIKNNSNKNIDKYKNISKPKKKIKNKKIKIKNKKYRVFNRENKLVNDKYNSPWINIVDNLLYDKTILNEVGYYHLKGFNFKKYEKKKLSKISKEIKEILFVEKFLDKINFDLNFDIVNFRKLKNN